MEKIEMGKGVLVPSYKCNQRCSCCYAMADIMQAKQTMSLEEAKKSIDFFEMIGIKTYTILGGEPLIYPYINEIIKYAISKNITSWIVTNGLMLSDSELGNKLFEDGLIGGCLSMFSLNKEIHESITNVKGSYDKLIKALENIKRYDWKFYPMFTVGEENINTIIEDVKTIAKMGYRRIYINYGIPNVVEEFNTGFDASPKALAKITEQLYDMQDDLGVTFIFNCEKNKIPICFFNEEKFKEMREKHQIGTGCELVQGNTVVIEPGGDVLGCSHWVKNVLMNIYKDYSKLETYTEEEFWNIWLNGYPAEIREKYSLYPFDNCQNCKTREKKECFGGCKTWHVYATLANKCKII